MTSDGRKTFFYRARITGPKKGGEGTTRNTRRLVIGDYPGVTLEQARQRVREWREVRRTGKNPKAEEARQRAATSDLEARKQAHSFGSVVEAYLAAKVIGKQRDGKDVARDLRTEFVNDRLTERKGKLVTRPGLGSKPVADVTEEDIRTVIDDALERSGATGSGAHAANLLGYARTLFGWIVERKAIYGVTVNPCSGISRKKTIGPKRKRKRVLNDREIRAVWWTADRLGYPYGHVVRLLLLTVARPHMITEARRADLDLRKLRKDGAPNPLLIIPAEKMKMDEAHTIPLTRAMLALIDDCPRFKGGDFLFSRNGGTGGVTLTAPLKKKFDRLVLSLLRAIARDEGEDPDHVELPPWTWMDLRRTARTRLSSLRIPSDWCEVIQAHKLEGVKGVYDQHRYDEEKREALTLWEAELARIVGTDPSKNFFPFASVMVA